MLEGKTIDVGVVSGRIMDDLSLLRAVIRQMSAELEKRDALIAELQNSKSGSFAPAAGE